MMDCPVQGKRERLYLLLNRALDVFQSDLRFRLIFNILKCGKYVLFSSEMVHRLKNEFLSALSNGVDSGSAFVKISNLFKLFEMVLDPKAPTPNNLEYLLSTLNFIFLLLIKSKTQPLPLTQSHVHFLTHTLQYWKLTASQKTQSLPCSDQEEKVNTATRKSGISSNSLGSSGWFALLAITERIQQELQSQRK
eukprot:TRINITY_DN7461_c0_g1_i5.p2 TRINITY_DN7461_c0_g1~~TRINITY_DN7461_c0_g1_i5.p2  ORF type:complete len:193 (-),score=37.30 TRINITY_DN7461_c0_g1_i5:14-592(-)